MFASAGEVVLILKYWSSNTIGYFFDVPKSTSPVLARTMENVKGEVVYLNWISAVLELDVVDLGRGKMDSGTS